MNNALTSIWNTTSKHFHGRDNSGVIIYRKFYRTNECLVFVALFTYFNVPFSYQNNSSETVDFYSDSTRDDYDQQSTQEGRRGGGRGM